MNLARRLNEAMEYCGDLQAEETLLAEPRSRKDSKQNDESIDQKSTIINNQSK